MAKKKILFLINSLTTGGAERVITTLLAHSTAEREEFDILLVLLDNVLRAYMPPRRLDVRQLDCRESMVRSILSVRALVRQERPDLALSFLTRANIATALACKQRAIPCVLSERINNSAHLPHNMGGAAARLFIRGAYPMAQRIIAVSSGVEEDLRANFGIAADKIVTIDNPVDADAIAAKAAIEPQIAIAGPYMLAAGRLTKVKNFALLIEAYAAANVAMKLVIIGAGDEREALTRQIETLGLQGRVLLPGHMDNPYALMKRAALYVSPSNAEGFPNALVEAMALGVPVVSSNCRSGPAEILAETTRDEVEGLSFAKHGALFPVGSSECLAAALKAMEDGELRARYAARAALRARDFSVERAKDRYWKVIRNELERRAETAALASS